MHMYVTSDNLTHNVIYQVENIFPVNISMLLFGLSKNNTVQCFMNPLQQQLCVCVHVYTHTIYKHTRSFNILTYTLPFHPLLNISLVQIGVRILWQWQLRCPLTLGENRCNTKNNKSVITKQYQGTCVCY